MYEPRRKVGVKKMAGYSGVAGLFYLTFVGSGRPSEVACRKSL